MSEHDQIRELIESYAIGAIGALDAQEVSAVETHLASGCAECSRALGEARWLVAQLAHLAPEAEPSEMLRARLLRTVRSEAKTSPIESPVPRSIPYWLWAGVAALLIFSVYSAWNAQRMQREITAMNERAAAQIKQREELQEELQMVRQQAQILGDPATTKFIMWPQDHEKGMPQLEASWHPKMGICVMGEKVPMPQKQHALQLWLIPKAPGGKPMPSRTFWPDANGNVAVMVDDPPEVIADTKALAITEEPAEGSAQPTGTPMWVGGVR